MGSPRAPLSREVLSVRSLAWPTLPLGPISRLCLQGGKNPAGALSKQNLSFGTSPWGMSLHYLAGNPSGLASTGRPGWPGAHPVKPVFLFSSSSPSPSSFDSQEEEEETVALRDQQGPPEQESPSPRRLR